MFSPGIHIAGPVRNTLIERNIIHLNQKMSKDIDRTMVTSDFGMDMLIALVLDKMSFIRQK